MTVFEVLNQLAPKNKNISGTTFRILAGKPGHSLNAKVLFRELKRRRVRFEAYADFWEEMGILEKSNAVILFKSSGEDYVRLYRQPFQILLPVGNQPEGFHCLVCGTVSYNADDVANRFCNKCQRFLNGASNADPS